MVLIADSGSSTTDWRIFDGVNIFQFKCIGLNPYIVDESIFIKSITSLKIPFNKITQLYFYGAGCSSLEKSNFVKSILKSIFVFADIKVYSDLLGAARALFQNNKGVIGILGTGSNIANYNGYNVIPFSISMGYLLADEGSGNALGKSFIKAFLSDKLDEDLKFGYDKSTILNELYSDSYPNRYLASYSKFIHSKRKHPQIAEIIKETFDEWVKVCLLPNNIKSLGLCGSIAFYFKSYLNISCKEYNISITKIIEKPIDALVLFHKKNQ